MLVNTRQLLAEYLLGITVNQSGSSQLISQCLSSVLILVSCFVCKHVIRTVLTHAKGLADRVESGCTCGVAGHAGTSQTPCAADVPNWHVGQGPREYMRTDAGEATFSQGSTRLDYLRCALQSRADIWTWIGNTKRACSLFQTNTIEFLKNDHHANAGRDNHTSNTVFDFNHKYALIMEINQ